MGRLSRNPKKGTGPVGAVTQKDFSEGCKLEPKPAEWMGLK